MTQAELVDLMQDSSCYACYSDEQKDLVITYLMVLRAGLPIDALSLILAANQFTQLSEAQMRAIQLDCLCVSLGVYPGCHPEQIMADSPCYACFSEEQLKMLSIRQLCIWNGGSPTPPTPPESDYEATDQGQRVTTDDGSYIVLNI